MSKLHYGQIVGDLGRAGFLRTAGFKDVALRLFDAMDLICGGKRYGRLCRGGGTVIKYMTYTRLGVEMTLLLICLCCFVSCVTEPIDVPKCAEQEHWKNKWREGNSEERREALTWCYHNYIKPGMPKAEVDAWLGNGFEDGGRGEGAGYFYGEIEPGLLLWVVYAKEEGSWRVMRATLVPN